MNAALLEEAERIADELVEARERQRQRMRERRAKLRERYAKGEKYWDGKPCEKHPGAPRYRSSSACCACVFERVAEGRAAKAKSIGSKS